ncbi:hypothetical protein U14_01409 [Candidatus Moduliflexus flocculans]|uniref:Uncharacterized protein n=1 Tax=Candidatus Moduliflexus flocculans TaxID=1499966 RepID=A0A0S6VY13_9BACT|nr:hypothetical protein U14_01409 [Candidatus Moduliflexus flocculans]
MKFTGKEVRILLGINTMFLHLPFGKSEKRQLLPIEEQYLEQMYNELFVEVERHAKWTNADPWRIKVSKRLNVSLNKEFSTKELQFLHELVTDCIQELQDDDGVNYYFTGNEYGIIFNDIKNFADRLAKELLNNR